MKQSWKSPRRGALPRAVLAATWLALPTAAWAQQATEDVKKEEPPKTEPSKEESPKTEPSRPAAEPQSAPKVVVNAGPEGFTLASSDKQFQLKLRGYIQADGRLFLDEKDRPAVNTFLIRRARPVLEGTLFGSIDFRLVPDFGGGTTVLQDAYLDIRPWSELRLRVGKFKPPIGLEQLQSDTNIVFVERNLPTNLVPNRDEGAQLFGEAFGGVLSYAAGAFNGTPDDASVDANLDDNVDLVGRLFVHPFRRTDLKPLQGLGFGLAASRGSQHGTTAATGLAPFRTVGQQTFFNYLSSTTTPADTVIADGVHTRLSPQGYFYFGPFGLLAEYVTSTQELRRGTEHDQVRNDAWQVAASYVLFGGSPTFEGVRPARPVRPSEGTWGAVELAAHYAELHIDPEAFPRFADPNRSARVAKGWGAAANWYIGGNNRIGLDLERTTFEGGAADGGDRKPEFVLLERFQASW
ncbi:OprO/OprP family phosphate-selective porin [Vitiosangium sp. GDMCC 1.1324]|uniref:OprO/OprP family phosphate-selective porin n=1 Tax=Vitiosangium sp. (strain GDMCC 1.1324) TaxID=2138576 RepID=UPI001E2B3265|nr:porin [Vitiosangium sp. GDMCC 1.1324]